MSSPPQTALKWFLRILSILVGICLIFGGFIYFAFWGCHGSGGFCAGTEHRDYLWEATALYLVGSFLIALSFTRKVWKIVITPLIVAAAIIAVLWTISLFTS